MSDNSKIQWTDATWPITAGCDHVSPGCDNCYAAKLTSGRLRHRPEYAGLAEDGRFNGTVRCLPERLTWPTKWRKPRRIFVCSMSDLFHADVPDNFIARAFAVMALCPQHTFQVLTKRHARMASLLGSKTFPILVSNAIDGLTGNTPRLRQRACPAGSTFSSWTWPLGNVWVGVSAEDQHWAEVRVHALLRTPAAVRWVSAEPLLGPIDLRNLKAGNGALIDALSGDVKSPSGEICAACPGSVGWVVAGGESGARARPMHPSWARSLRGQCQATRTPYLFKQWGSHRWVAGSRFNEETVCWEDCGIQAERCGVKAAGRELDGRTWDQYPAAREAVESA